MPELQVARDPTLQYAAQHERAGNRFAPGRFLGFREHLHGALAIAPDEVELAKQVLMSVAGDYEAGNNALRVREMASPMGVGGYATKEIEFSVLRARGADAKGPRFTRSAFTRTDPLARRARRLYEFHRLLHQEICRRHGENRIEAEDAFLDLQAA